MSRYGDEMVAELANLLNKHSVGLDKTASEKEKEEKCKKCEKEPCKCEELKEKEEAKEAKEEAAEEAKEEKAKKDKAKKDKKKKKAEFMSSVLSNLVKLAEELDAAGADEAASLVDDALKVIVKNIKEDK